MDNLNETSPALGAQTTPSRERESGVEAGCALGMVGLGVMGRNLLLNFAGAGYPVAGYDRHESKVRALVEEAGDRDVRPARTLGELVAKLRRPRAVMLLVQAGSAVDAVIEEAKPLLAPGDLIVDGGNSNFRDTDRRARELAQSGLQFLGVGISGGEYGARHGASVMAGGPAEAWERVGPLLTAVAAVVGTERCAAHVGPGSAGHYVKMVHNGIEYGVMQLIAETYDLMRRGLGLDRDELREVFERWSTSELDGYLVEITAAILGHTNEQTGQLLVDVIRDEAHEKGTGQWTSQEAMGLRVPVPTIDAAVSMRALSALRSERKAIRRALGEPSGTLAGDRPAFLAKLGNALYAAMLATYAQGFALLRTASLAYDYDLRSEEIARIWRGGCIIRARLLELIRGAYQAQPRLENLLTSPEIARRVAARLPDLRTVACAAAEHGIAAPGMMASLGYVDAFRSARLPTNLIQAQRDYFGAHTYERIDAGGVFHTRWSED